MMLHWDVWSPHPHGDNPPQWRAQLCDNGTHFGPIFTYTDMHQLIGLVRNHDRLYPVYLCCFWSEKVARAARITLDRAGLTLSEPCIPF